jgi:hypothetical protein
MPRAGLLEWVMGTGYVRLWEQIHRLQESITLLGPPHRVIAGAIDDETRLLGSTIENRDLLLERLREAVRVLMARAGVVSGYLPSIALAAPVPPYSVNDELVARTVLRDVRRAIDEFRDERRLGLVRARNQLMRTVLVTNVVLLAIFALAIEVGAPARALVAAAVFFLVGAMMGLFNRLYLDASAETAIEDYGVSTARLFHTPLFSGLGAVGGVLVIPMLSVLVNPPGGTTSGAGLAGIAIPGLATIFDLDGRPFGLVIAAVFGLSPGILISRLQQEAERFKADLKSTQAPARS